jgi:prophage regulatory protein
MKILRKPEVCERTGYSYTQIWRFERAGQFPKRIRIGPNAVGWLETEIDEWISAKVAARDAGAGQ